MIMVADTEIPAPKDLARILCVWFNKPYPQYWSAAECDIRGLLRLHAKFFEDIIPDPRQKVQVEQAQSNSTLNL